MQASAQRGKIADPPANPGIHDMTHEPPLVDGAGMPVHSQPTPEQRQAYAQKQYEALLEQSKYEPHSFAQFWSEDRLDPEATKQAKLLATRVDGDPILAGLIRDRAAMLLPAMVQSPSLFQEAATQAIVGKVTLQQELGRMAMLMAFGLEVAAEEFRRNTAKDLTDTPDLMKLATDMQAKAPTPMPGDQSGRMRNLNTPR